ncbi:General stress protein 14 [Chryseobacterium gleum]|uniref:General stress protein 14 n=2 Tax=Chryseobacterium gleum TaxID=250 RepID=A0A448B2R0_CHRGE|nr:NAD(P)H-dependent oxidoreductase [Chryseobacterium gleum]EFK32987.1 flavodoxin-like protein [Chryseobacterium gleum ATCC 35910]QQY33820.1 NAD(P)H-dependent oxidoreductase [Chryseobacterium gleum]VEE07933.1 General stress protein 14 [Chryseobacterium gleum]
MRHLIIYAHPNENSLNHNLLNTVVDTLRSQHHEIIVRDLYKIGFDPVLSLADMQGQRMGKASDDVKTEQDHISWAEQITFIYPIWWTGLPAMMKGYIDRVFSYGFAYRYDQGVQKGLLKGKSTMIINTHGKSSEEYEKTGMDKALTLTSDHGIFIYSGLEIIRHLFFDKADRASSEDLEIWKEQIKNLYSKHLIHY